MELVDPRLDCCIRRSSRRRSHSHQSRNGAPVVGLVVVVVVVVVDAMQGEVVVGCSFCVVMGATRKSFYHQEQFHGSIILDTLPPNIFPDVFLGHRNELLPDPLELSRPQNVS